MTEIDTALVRRLIAEQFPQWANLPVEPVTHDGWDNRTFRLGDEMSVRLPSAEWYVPQVEKEHHWLSRLAPQLPLAIPVPLARGAPSDAYPWTWSVYRWIDGEIAMTARVDDLDAFARDLARFLNALHEIDASDGPPPGAHNFLRGAHIDVYDTDTRKWLDLVRDEVDVALVTDVWETALGSKWSRAPVWIHGDVAATNLLVRNGRLSAVIDFGCSGSETRRAISSSHGPSWTKRSRTTFREIRGLDEATWARGRAWALWKALIEISRAATDPVKATAARVTLDAVLAEHRATS